MRARVAAVLIAILAIGQLRAQQAVEDSSIKRTIASLPPSSLVEISMKGGDRLRGHIVGRTDADFSLQREKKGGTQKVAYDQVLSVSQIKGHSNKKWIIIGVVAGVIVVIGIIAAVVASHPLG